MTTKTQSRDRKTLASKPEPRETKIGKVAGLLKRKQGASLEQMTSATGWQAHTVRAALTGLKKKGHAIEREAVEGGSRYRIVKSTSA